MLGSRHFIRDLVIAAALGLGTFYGFAIGLGVGLPAARHRASDRAFLPVQLHARLPGIHVLPVLLSLRRSFGSLAPKTHGGSMPTEMSDSANALGTRTNTCDPAIGFFCHRVHMGSAGPSGVRVLLLTKGAVMLRKAVEPLLLKSIQELPGAKLRSISQYSTCRIPTAPGKPRSRCT